MTELGHRDEADRPCERHPLDLSALLQLAAIGSRTQSFNHDVASKIQGLMMAIDEITELATTADLKQAAETAHSALADLNQLLQQSRALTKPPVSTRMPLHDLVAKAATRVGVTLRGDRAAGDVEVAIPLITQALALVFDAASGTDRRRSLQLAVRSEPGWVELTFPFAAMAAPPGDQLAVAAWIVERDRGRLRCSDKAIVIRLPIVE